MKELDKEQKKYVVGLIDKLLNESKGFDDTMPAYLLIRWMV